MKKFLGLLFALGLISPAFAYEDYIVSIGDTIAQIKNKTPDTISVEVVTTIKNARDTIIVSSIKEGTGKFSIILENGQISNFTVLISKDKTEIKTDKSYIFFKIDEIEDAKNTTKSQEFDFELDLPPGVEWNK